MRRDGQSDLAWFLLRMRMRSFMRSFASDHRRVNPDFDNFVVFDAFVEPTKSLIQRGFPAANQGKPSTISSS